MTSFFTQFVLLHASDNITSRNNGGMDAWAAPRQILGDRTPVPPKSPPMVEIRKVQVKKVI